MPNAASSSSSRQTKLFDYGLAASSAVTPAARTKPRATTSKKAAERTIPASVPAKQSAKENLLPTAASAKPAVKRSREQARDQEIIELSDSSDDEQEKEKNKSRKRSRIEKMLHVPPLRLQGEMTKPRSSGVSGVPRCAMKNGC